MAIEITVQNESGEFLKIVHDSRNFMPELLERSMCEEPRLAEIDWYGNTVFNRLQLPRFLSEWQVVARHAQNDEETKLVNEVKALAEKCQGGVHLYLKFIGDQVRGLLLCHPNPLGR